jgi:hypothetical protein
MQEEASVEDMVKAYIESWGPGLKAVAIYRDNSSLIPYFVLSCVSFVCSSSCVKLRINVRIANGEAVTTTTINETPSHGGNCGNCTITRKVNPMMTPSTSRTRNCARGLIRCMLRIRTTTPTATASGIKISGTGRGIPIRPFDFWCGADRQPTLKRL